MAEVTRRHTHRVALNLFCTLFIRLFMRDAKSPGYALRHLRRGRVLIPDLRDLQRDVAQLTARALAPGQDGKFQLVARLVR